MSSAINSIKIWHFKHFCVVVIESNHELNCTGRDSAEYKLNFSEKEFLMKMYGVRLESIRGRMRSAMNDFL